MREDRVGWLPKIVAILVFLFLMAPLLVIILASFSPTSLVVFPPKGFSLEWYANIFSSSTNFIGGFGNSIKIAVAATALDIVLGVTASLAVSRYRFKGRDGLITFFTSPMYVPSITFAFVLLQVFSIIAIPVPEAMQGLVGRATITIPAGLRIFLGHAVIILPYIVRNTLAVLATFNWTLEDAAASLGANPFQVFRRVTFPLIRPGIVAGGLLSFLYSFDEAVLSALLSSPKFITLPIRIMNYMEFSFDPTLAAISTVLIVLSFVSILLMEKLVGLDMFVK